MKALWSDLKLAGLGIAAALVMVGCGGDSSSSSDGSAGTTCPTGSGYSVGDRGPAGGWIFYVDSADSYDFTYLEAAPQRLELDDGTNVLHQWASSYGGAYSIGGTGEGIGTGEANTQLVANSLTNDGQSNRAVHRVLDFDLEGCGWFLPSKNELNAIYINLVQPDIADVPGGFYWTSSEGGVDQVWAQSMSFGTQQAQLKGTANSVWPVRAF